MQTAKARAHLKTRGKSEDFEGGEHRAGADDREAEGPRAPAEAAGAGARQRRLPHRLALLIAPAAAPPHSKLVAPARTQHTKRFVMLILLCNI